MPNPIFQTGQLICLEADYKDSQFDPVDPPDARFDVIDPLNVAWVSNETPTQVAPGRYRGCWFAPLGAPTGEWQMVFKGTIEDESLMQVCNFDLQAASATSQTGGLCGAWASIDDLCEPCLHTDSYTIDPARMNQKLLEASEILYHLSAQQFTGPCFQQIRPCAKRVILSSPAWYAGSSALARTMGFMAACGCFDNATCSCKYLPAIRLPADTVQSITQVSIGGAVLDQSAYELRDNQLIRTDGHNWPCCDTEDFIVSFISGRPAPAIGVTAAAVLGCELYLSCYPSDAEGAVCRLPRNIQTISRQGVSVLLASFTRTRSSLPFRFGLLEVDIFLETFSPHGNRSQSVVISPDTVPTAQRVN